MRICALCLLSALFLVLVGGTAFAQGRDVLSVQQLALADCAGQALAVEQAMQTAAPGGDHLAAVARADALLRVAINRYVAVGRVAAFRRRAALALAAETMRMQLAVQISGDADRAIDRADRDVEEACRRYLE